MKQFKRHLLLSVLGAMTLTSAHMVRAQAAFPGKPVTITTAFAAGSGPDAVLRQVSDKLSKLWNQPVLVNNKPGGGGFIAMDSVQRLPADGYNLLQPDSEHLAAVPHLYKSKNFVTLNTFDPVVTLFRTPFFIAVSSESKWQNIKDLVAEAKASPGKVSYGSWGIGSPGHLGGEEIEWLSAVDMTHVAFREVSQLYTGVATGDIQWAFASIPSSAGVFKSGKIRYLAIAAQARTANARCADRGRGRWPQRPGREFFCGAGGTQRSAHRGGRAHPCRCAEGLGRPGSQVALQHLCL